MPQNILAQSGNSGLSVARQNKTSFRPAHQYLNFSQYDLDLDKFANLQTCKFAPPRQTKVSNFFIIRFAMHFHCFIGSLFFDSSHK